MSPARPAAKTFEAILEPSHDRLRWVIARIPFEPGKVWGKGRRFRVKGEINGFAFRTSLFPTGSGGFFMIVNKGMQAGGRVSAGMKARFRLEPDLEKREIKQPLELQKALGQSKRLQKFFSELNFSMRRYFCDLVAQGKHPETRVRRAEQMAEQFMQTIEAERELPPVLQTVMRNNPKAAAGWELMPPSHRRHQLLGIFYQRNPATQARRIAKTVEMMLECAEKRERGRRSG